MQRKNLVSNVTTLTEIMQRPDAIIKNMSLIFMFVVDTVLGDIIQTFHNLKDSPILTSLQQDFCNNISVLTK